MHFLRLLITLALCQVVTFVIAQRDFIGKLDGVYPFTLSVAADGTTGTLQYDSGQPIEFTGTCKGERCKLHAQDTAMSLIASVQDGNMEGKLFVATIERSFSAISGPVPTIQPKQSLPSQSWLKRWVSSNGDYTLVLAHLPGGRLSGYLYAAKLRTSLPVVGAYDSRKIELGVLSRSDNSVSELVGANQLGTDALSLILKMDGTKNVLTFTPVQHLDIVSNHALGRYDISFPVTGEEEVDGTITDIVDGVFSTIKRKKSDYGYAWFEPSRLDDRILSGWVHVHLPDGQHSYAMNVDMKNGKQLRRRTFFGRSITRRQEQELGQKLYEFSVEQHPLEQEEDFRDWAAGQSFDNFVLRPEGLVFGSDLHRLYGQLSHVEPWRFLERRERLPDWITSEPHSVPAEKHK